MKIDKEKLKALAELPDDELWAKIKTIAASHGFKLPENTPPHTELQKVRDAVGGKDKINLSGALKIINNYRRGEKK